MAEQTKAILQEAALPEEVEAMRRAEDEYARGDTVRLEDLQRELGLTARHSKKRLSLRAQRGNLVDPTRTRIEVAASPCGLLAMTGQ